MVDVSVVIPVADYHDGVLERALRSCTSQSVPVEVIVYRDTEHLGAGHARNQAFQSVTTPFVVFLDADDELAPTFAERCLSIISPRRYVYTDWMEGDVRKLAPCQPWRNRSWHVITTLLWTEDVRAIGGFDETLPGGEDTDLYLRLMQSGVCGIRMAEPLFFYAAEGKRAREFVHGSEYQHVLKLFDERYGANLMPCGGGCGDGNIDMLDVPVDGQPGDMLMIADWNGNRQERGKVTGRLYPRGGNKRQMYVDPLDASARPDLWKPVAANPPLTSLDALASAMFPGLRPAPPPPPEKAPTATSIAPNFRKADELYRRGVQS